MKTAAELLADIPALADAEPVTRVTIPARLDYTYSPGGAQSRFLTALTHRQLIGERCPKCTRVYIPPRGVCPTCGRTTDEQVDLPETGTVTMFCIVNIAAKGLDIEIPYCYAYVLLDGAHVGLHARIGGLPHDRVHVGLRVRAVWRDTGGRPAAGLAAISHFEPTGDPDAAPASYRSWM